MEIVEQLKASNPMLIIAVVGMVALFLAIKIGHAADSNDVGHLF